MAQQMKTPDVLVQQYKLLADAVVPGLYESAAAAHTYILVLGVVYIGTPMDGPQVLMRFIQSAPLVVPGDMDVVWMVRPYRRVNAVIAGGFAAGPKTKLDLSCTWDALSRPELCLSDFQVRDDTLLLPVPDGVVAVVDKLRTALEHIRDEEGKVCSEYDLCCHRACQSSYTAWVIADTALKNVSLS